MNAPMYPTNSWGPLASDPWSNVLEPEDDAAWKDAVAASRAMRQAFKESADPVDAGRSSDPEPLGVPSA